MDTAERILSLYKQGNSVTTITKTLGVSRKVVFKSLVTNEIFPTRMSRDVNDMLKEGFSLSEIAKQFDVKKDTLLAYTPYRRSAKPKDSRRLIR